MSPNAVCCAGASLAPFATALVIGGPPCPCLRKAAHKRLAYRNGAEYCRPPLVHSAFRPRSSFSGVPGPTLRSKISP